MWTFPGIGIVDLDAPELPSHDRKMLEVATERMFAEPSILETIVSLP
jgi:RNA polymerase-interacting CarD/CdnL/TRCF family regulator